MSLNTGGITTRGAPQGISGLAVAVTSSSGGTVPRPAGYVFGWCVVSNSSPWSMTVTGAAGQKTIQPFSADLVIPVAAGIPYAMSAPPGPVITAPNPFIQGDWYVAGGGKPDGTFPVALTSAAVTAAIASLNTQTELDSRTVPATSAFNLNYSIPANTVGIGVFTSKQSNTNALEILGVTSGQLLLQVGGNPPINAGVPAMTDSYYQCLVAPNVDTQINVIFSNSLPTSIVVTIVAYSQLPTVRGLLIGQSAGPDDTTGQPLITNSGGPPHTPSSVQATAGGAVLLGAPTAGFVWEIVLLSIFANTATTNAGNAFVKGTASGTFYVGTTVVAAAATVPPAVWSGIMKISEGLTAVTGLTGANLECQAVARLMPDVR